MKPDMKRDRESSRAVREKLRAVIAASGKVPVDMVKDAERGEDFVVGKTRVLVHTRDNKYLQAYPFDITVREGREGSYESEMSRIIGGRWRYILYAYRTDDGRDLAAWRIADLDVLRDCWGKGLRGEVHGNKDGTTTFRVFHLPDMPPALIVAEWKVPTVELKKPALATENIFEGG